MEDVRLRMDAVLIPLSPAKRSHDRSGAPGYHEPVIINGTSELGNTHGGWNEEPTSYTISQVHLTLR